MAKDDLANLRLDLAPKLNRPLSLWNPLDYLRLLFWVFYFPQALRWYIKRFGEGYSQSAKSTWRTSLRAFRLDPIQQGLFFQGLIILGIILLQGILRNPPGDSNELILLALAFMIVVGIYALSGILGNVTLALIYLPLVLMIPFVLPWALPLGESTEFDAQTIAIRIGASIGLLFGISFSFYMGSIRTISSGIVLGLIFGTLSWNATFGLALSTVTAISSLRPDSWIVGIIAGKLGNRKSFSKMASTTIMPLFYLNRITQEKLKGDWHSSLNSLDEIILYTNQLVYTIGLVNNELSKASADMILWKVSRLASSHARIPLIEYCTKSVANALCFEFVQGILFLPFRNRLLARISTSPRIDFPSRAAAAGFWYLHEEKPAEAAQAFAVVRDIRHGEEMHGLASLLALFDAAETAEQIAAIELPNLPRDRTLRPQTWAAIDRLCHVVSDTKTAQVSASRTARAFATNRALGELQHIIEHETDLPEAERSLVIKIAKTWRNALLEITAEVGALAIAQPVQNPYVIGDPVEGDLFVGRDDIMRQLQELWLMGNHLQSVVIYGHRRMGKTSILKNIEPRLGSGIHVAYVNLLKSAGAETLSDVLLAISDQVATTLAIAPPSDADMETNPDRTFDRFLRRATDTLADGKGLIIALDEFEKIEELIDAGKLEASFLAYLRGLVQDSPKVGFAFAGLHTLEEMSADYFQPFFASVIPIKVDFFKPATVQTLLPNPGGDFPLDYDYDALDAIWELTAGQPYLTQLIGFQLVRRYNDQVFERQQPRDPKFAVEDVQAVVSQPEFFTQGKPYFQGVWAQAGQDPAGQRAILAALAPHPTGLALAPLQAASGLDGPTFAAALAALTNHDVVRQNANTVHIIVEVFRRWVLSQP